MLEIIRKSPDFGKAESSADDGFSSAEVESTEGESPGGDTFDDPGKIKKGKQEKQVLEDESEANGQIQRVSSAGAKFLIFLSLPADTLLHHFSSYKQKH